jgi:CspA family cold shock protein
MGAAVAFVLTASGRSKMATGKVQWFNPVMGTGYIKPADGGTDILVRRLAVELAGWKSLTAGQNLQYEVATGLDGRISAVTLKPLARTSPENEIGSEAESEAEAAE